MKLSPQAVVTNGPAEEALRAQWAAFHQKYYAVEAPPAGAINARDYAKINQLTAASARMVLLRFEERGSLQSGKFRVMVAGECRIVRFWWPAKKTQAVKNRRN